MIILPYSDLHINFQNFDTPDLSSVDVLVLAGDTGEGTDLFRYSFDLLEKYENLKIVAVAGNHEFYNGYPMDVLYEFYENCNKLNNRFHFLQNSSVIIDNVKFIGATLWTNFFDENPIAMMDAYNLMNDYVYSYYTKSMKLTPDITLYEHKQSVKYIFEELKNTDPSVDKQVVVTHHKPYLSSSSPSSVYYESRLKQLDNIRPDIWIYGHTHKADYDILYGDLRVISNPRGYSDSYSLFHRELQINI